MITKEQYEQLKKSLDSCNAQFPSGMIIDPEGDGIKGTFGDIVGVIKNRRTGKTIGIAGESKYGACSFKVMNNLKKLDGASFDIDQYQNQKRNSLLEVDEIIDNLFDDSFKKKIGTRMFSNAISGTLKSYFPSLAKTLNIVKIQPPNSQDIIAVGYDPDNQNQLNFYFSPYVFFKVVLMEASCNYVRSGKKKTASYNDFVKLMDLMSTFIVMHELNHIIWRHLKKKDEVESKFDYSRFDNLLKDQFINNRVLLQLENIPPAKEVMKNIGIQHLTINYGMQDTITAMNHINQDLKKAKSIKKHFAAYKLTVSNGENYLKDFVDDCEKTDMLELTFQNTAFDRTYEVFSTLNQNFIICFTDINNPLQIQEPPPIGQQKGQQGNSGGSQSGQSGQSGGGGSSGQQGGNQGQSGQSQSGGNSQSGNDQDGNGQGNSQNGNDSGNDQNGNGQGNSQNGNGQGQGKDGNDQDKDGQGNSGNGKDRDGKDSNDSGNGNGQGKDGKDGQDKDGPGGEDGNNSDSGNSSGSGGSGGGQSNSQPGYGQGGASSVPPIHNVPDSFDSNPLVQDAIKEAMDKIKEAMKNGKSLNKSNGKGNSDDFDQIFDPTSTKLSEPLKKSEASGSVNKDWRKLLKKIIENAAGVTIERVSYRPNRRRKGIWGANIIKQELENIVFSFDLSGSMDVRRDFSAALEYLSDLVKTNISFKKVSFVYWGDNVKAFGPYTLNPKTLKEMALAKQPKDRNGNAISMGGTYYDAAIAPFVSSQNLLYKETGKLKSIASKVDLMIVFTDGGILGPDDPNVKAWIRRMRKKTIYILKHGSQPGSVHQYMKNIDPSWKDRAVVASKSKSGSNDNFY